MFQNKTSKNSNKSKKKKSKDFTCILQIFIYINTKNIHIILMQETW